MRNALIMPNSTCMRQAAPIARRRCLAKPSICLPIFFMLVLSGGAQLKALTINLTFDSSVTSLPNASQYQAAATNAAQQLESIITNNITVNIKVVAAAGTGTFGMSDFGLIESNYSQIRGSLIANNSAAAADLPATDPTGGGTFLVNYAQAKAMGLIAANDPASDGTFTFGAGYTYALDPSHRAVAGKYDFIGIAEHEMTEIMGRSALLGQDLLGNGGSDYIPYDLFRYSGPGARSLVAGNNNYFSISNGMTNLMTFNFPNGNGTDPQDWGATMPYTPDACNNVSFSGTENDFSQTDVTAMNIMGYSIAASPTFTNGPPPGTVSLGAAYNFTYAATYTPATTFAVATGSLPPGVNLSSNGVLSGTPTQTGTYSGTVTASNFFGAVTQAFNITVGGTAQTITFNALSSHTVADAPFSVNASASSGLGVTFTVASGPATISGNTITINGTGAVTIEVSQSGNSTYDAAPNVMQSFQVTGGTTFTTWEGGFGAVSALAATPENDGISNLLKYLFDINPSREMTAADHAALPAFSIADSGGADYLALTYRQYARQTGITVNVQTSSDLQTWQTETNPTFTEIGLDPVTSDPIMQVEVPVSTTALFIRLNVTSP